MTPWEPLSPWAGPALCLGLSLMGLGLGLLLGRLQKAKTVRALESRITRLNTQLVIERQRHRERIAAMDQARRQLAATFAALSRRALKDNSESFLNLARENLRQFQVHAEDELEQREQAIETLVRPIREALDKTEQQIKEIEKERKEAFGSLAEHLRHVTAAQQHLQAETRHLVKALRRPEVRGQWGELTLRRLVELSGMATHCDFYEQEQRRTAEGTAVRPDMIVRVPDGREIIVDAKTPLDAYLSAVEAADDTQRVEHLRRHARKVRERVNELAGKRYWAQFENSPDFVVLFIPGDQFLSAAMEYDSGLLEEALRQKIVLATPTSLIALLRAVAFGWRQLVVAENVEKIRELAEELYHRVATFSEHMSRLGRGLSNSVDQYNRAVGSLERQVLPSARKFTELGIQTRKEIEALDPIEKGLRAPAKN